MEKTRSHLQHIHTVADPLIAGHIAAVLEARGIHCLVRNRHLMGGAGEIPPLEAWPEIWVDAEDVTIAKQLVAEVLAPTAPAPDDWTCERCGERIEGQFAQCWNCGGMPG